MTASLFHYLCPHASQRLAHQFHGCPPALSSNEPPLLRPRGAHSLARACNHAIRMLGDPLATKGFLACLTCSALRLKPVRRICSRRARSNFAGRRVLRPSASARASPPLYTMGQFIKNAHIHPPFSHRLTSFSVLGDESKNCV